MQPCKMLPNQEALRAKQSYWKFSIKQPAYHLTSFLMHDLMQMHAVQEPQMALQTAHRRLLNRAERVQRPPARKQSCAGREGIEQTRHTIQQEPQTPLPLAVPTVLEQCLASKSLNASSSTSCPCTERAPLLSWYCAQKACCPTAEGRMRCSFEKVHLGGGHSACLALGLAAGREAAQQAPCGRALFWLWGLWLGALQAYTTVSSCSQECVCHLI